MVTHLDADHAGGIPDFPEARERDGVGTDTEQEVHPIAAPLERRAMMEYMEREGDRMPAFCQPLTVAESPEAQSVTMDIEVPAFWSQLATNVVVSKYFRRAGVPASQPA